MKNIKKRLTSIMLVFVLLMTMLPVTVMATETEVQLADPICEHEIASFGEMEEALAVEVPVENSAEDSELLQRLAPEEESASQIEEELSFEAPTLLAGEGTAFGECGAQGNNLTWALDDEGILTISGTGEMEDYWRTGGDSAPWYSRRGDITAVVIESSVTSIGDRAFYDCYNLTNAVIPNSVTSIGGGGFACCASLTNITIPESVTSIGISAFEGCENLAAIRIPNGVMYIDDWTFASCTSLADITIPNSVTGIGNFAFDSCFSLTNITIPDSVTNIGECAFRHCNSLTDITIPNHVITIGSEVFYGCSNLDGITVASGNTAYASQNGLLYNRDKTELICCPAGKTGTIEIPGSVNAIWENAFSECCGVTAITVANGNTAYVSQNGILYNSDKTELVCCPAGKTGTVEIPGSVSVIGHNAFADCGSLTDIMIPNSVTEIAYGSFAKCSGLSSVTIPNSVVSIDTWAFGNCGGLNGVVFEGDAPSFGWGTFYGITTTAYYPVNNATWTDDVKQNYGGHIRWAMGIPVSTEAEVRAAMIAAAEDPNTRHEITIDFPLTLTENLEIPVNVDFNIWTGGSLTIPEGVTLTTVGKVHCITDLTVAGTWRNDPCKRDESIWWDYVHNLTVSGRLENNSDIECNSLTLECTGEITTGESITVYNGYTNNGGTVIGNPIVIWHKIYATEADVRAAIIAAAEAQEELYNIITIDFPLTLTEDLEIPENAELNIWEGMTIPEGVTLTVFGHIYCDTTLTVAGTLHLEDSGWMSTSNLVLEHTGIIRNQGYLRVRESFANNGGTVIGDAIRHEIYAATEADVRAAVAAAEESPDESYHIIIEFPLTLTEDLEIPVNVDLNIWNEGSLTIPEGVTLTVVGNIYCDTTLTVAGTLHLEDSGWMSTNNLVLEHAGIIRNQGDLQVRESFTNNGGTVTGEPIVIRHEIFAATEAEVRAATAAAEESPDESYNIRIEFPLTLTEDLEIPVNVDLNIWNEGSLTIPEGVTLTTAGLVNCDTILTVAGTWRKDPCEREGSIWCDFVHDLTVSGRLENHSDNSDIRCDNLTLESTGEIANGGSIYVYNDYTNNGGTVTGEPIVIRHEIYAATEADVRAAVAAAVEAPDESYHIIIEFPLTLTEDLEIPVNVDLNIRNGGGLTIPEGVTLTTAGSVNCDTILTVAGTWRNDPCEREGLIWWDFVHDLTVSGRLENHSYIGCDNLTLESTGEIANGGSIYVYNDYTNNGGTVIGDAICHEIFAATEAEVRAATAAAEESPDESYHIIIEFPLTLTEDLEIPVNVDLNIWNEGSLAIPAGVTLTTAGKLYASNMTVAGAWNANHELNCVENLTIESSGVIRNKGLVEVPGIYINHGDAIPGVVGCGDVNGDGEVNALDLLRVKKALAAGTFDSAQMDVTGDGTINALDLLRLKRYLAGENVELSYGYGMISSSPVTG